MDSRFHRNTNRTRSTKPKMADFFRVEFLYYKLKCYAGKEGEFCCIEREKSNGKK